MQTEVSTEGTKDSIDVNLEKLEILNGRAEGASAENVLNALKQDKVVLVKGLLPEGADQLMAAVADALHIRNELEIQAGFASIKGHRQNIGRYYMTVNNRDNYEFITPHSEGTSAVNMQLASFYCYENSTDGGESLLFNVDSENPLWSQQREQVVKARITKSSVSPVEIAQGKALFEVDIEKDVLHEDDEILEQVEVPVDGIELYNVLSPARKTYSKILDKELYAYWDSVASVDRDSAEEYFRFLTNEKIMHHPATPLTVEQADVVRARRIWNSGVEYQKLFKSQLTIKLSSGDFVLMNNLSWVHSANNWTPSSGVRNVSAAFA
ncbi:MAG: hypothetical protein ACI9WC_000121 [Arenicella sp.]|jgi:hypothetical protein